MFKYGKLSSIIFENKINPNFKINIQLVNFIHNTLFNNVKTAIKVNDYLLNRNIPATDILNSLKDEDAKTLEKIKCEYSFKVANNQMVPKHINDTDYLEMLSLSIKQRERYFHFLANREYKNQSDYDKKMARLAFREEEPNQDSESISINRIYSKYTMKPLKTLAYARLRRSIVLKHQEIVFDFSYEDEMTRRELKTLADQITYCYSRNKNDEEPFHMVFANLNPSSILKCDLNKHFIPNNNKSIMRKIEDYPMTVSSKHYLDLYPNRKIVYLSPNSNNFFQEGEYDHDAIYVIGGLVELGAIKPLTLSRARSEGLEHRALPIDRYMSWKNGSRDLTLDQVFKAMLIARNTNGDWGRALKFSVPHRHLIDKAFQNYKPNIFNL